MSFFSWLRKRTSTRSTRWHGLQIRPTTRRFRPRLEALEDRWMPSTLTVTNNLDSGAGSLRADIAAAKSGDTIVFAPSLDGKTITLTSGELSITTGMTIQGPGAAQLTISGGHASRVFDVASSQPVTLTGLTISNGHCAVSSSGGGGIFNSGNLTINLCTIVGCTAYNGGGIYNYLGTLTVSGSSLTSDHAAYQGGGILNRGALTLSQCTVSHDQALSGGGIDNVGTLTATGCTISSDVASSHNSGGGGIYTSGTLTATGCTLFWDSASNWVGGGIEAMGGRTTLTNCTLALNYAFGNSQTDLQPNSPSTAGGGLYVGGSNSLLNGPTYVTNCTVSANRAVVQPGGGIGVEPGFELVLRNSIVAGNIVATSLGYSEQADGADIYDINDGPGAPILDHDLIGNVYGLFSNLNGVNGNIVGGPGHVINAMLGPLQNNGGPTMTMALRAGSPAIGTADNAAAPATDQRGFTRLDVAGELTDIGAVEL
jgi:hypothetical protein